MMKVLRFIGAVILAIITSLFISFLADSLFGFTAYTFGNASFWRIVLYLLALNIGVPILGIIAQLLTLGFTYIVQGSKFIAIVVILVFINYFCGECVFLLGDTHFGFYSDSVLEMLKETAGSFYTVGAIITLIMELICYALLSLFLFIKLD